MTNDFISKNDYRNIVENIMDFIKPYCSEGHSRIFLNKEKLPCNDIAAREDFSNVLWAFVPFIKGGGNNVNIEELYRLGTINGTNPNSSEYWGICGNCDNISDVMASVACGILMTSDIIMDLFTKNERQDIVNWLFSVNYYSFGMDDRQFLTIIANSALKFLGRPYDSEKLKNAFNAVEALYIGNGWYGVKGKKDYNITMSMQFYSLIYAKIMAGYEAIRCEIYKKRAKKLISDLNNSSLLHNGTNDIALIGFCSACIFADVDIADTDVMNMIKKAMPVYTEYLIDSYLNGNKGHNDKVNRCLTWYMKAFLVLTLPEEHKFWNAV